MMQEPMHLLWRSEQDTAAFAARLARVPALRNAFIALQGDLGAGKTTLVRHLLHALGVTGHIKSPTYTIVEPYKNPQGLAIWHFDFYRFSDPHELHDAGLHELFFEDGLKLAEWPEHAGALLPTPDLVLRLDVGAADERYAVFDANTATGRTLIAALTS